MLSLDYLVVQKFISLEALGMRGARHGDPADPIALTVAVTRSDDITSVIETVIARKETRTKLWRAAIGKWVFKLDPRLYQDGVGYTVHFKFAMTPNNTNVVRQSFVWAAPLEAPHGQDRCLIYGTLQDMLGLPESGGHLVVETYSDFVTLNQRTGLEDVVGDIFGNWYVSLKKGSLVRFVFGEGSTLVQIPMDKTTADYQSLPRYQPKDLVRTDNFGYPAPITGG